MLELGSRNLVITHLIIGEIIKKIKAFKLLNLLIGMERGIINTFLELISGILLLFVVALVQIFAKVILVVEHVLCTLIVCGVPQRTHAFIPPSDLLVEPLVIAAYVLLCAKA